MNFKGIFLTFFSILTFFCTCFAQNTISFRSRDNKFVIVIPDNASQNQIRAAEELRNYIRYIFDSDYKIAKSSEFKGSKAIFLGKMPQSEALVAKFGNEIRDDGFLIHTEKNKMFIFGNASKSELYGVYHFLENYLECSCVCPNEIYYPKNLKDKELSIHDLQNPSFSYRETLQIYPNISQEYADWHKLHNRNDLHNDWGMFVHTFQHLIPAENYFDFHPEWFSEIKGNRIKDSQLCLTNDDVLNELCENLKSMMLREPDKKIWSVSQNDNENSCTCEKCLRSDSIYGGPSGTMLNFVNKVARRFPNKTISTLAYLQTRKPPKNVVPEENVNIMFCSIECQRQIPIAENSAEKGFVNDLIGWTNLTHNVFMWDYVVQFKHYMDPFPNLHVLQPNLQLFNKYHVSMMFEQGSSDLRSENSEWRTFLLAHLMWNVNIDVDSLRKVFLSEYYGANRAPFVAEYFDLMTDELLKSGQVLNIYGFPIDAIDGYLSPENIKKYQLLFEKAYSTLPFDYMKNGGNVEIYNDRLRRLELALDFAVLDISLRGISPELSYFDAETKVKNEEMLQKLENFITDCKRLEVTHLNESGYVPYNFYSDVQHFIAKNTKPNLAAGKKVECLTKWSDSYNPGAPQCLTDGISGNTDYRSRWLGFQHEDFDAIVDLESVETVNEVSIDFYFYPLSWIFAPKKVTFFGSTDGENWKEMGSSSYENEQILTKTALITFNVNIDSEKFRFIRIKAESLKTNPEWHRGCGQPCWIFTDEIFVR